MTFEFQLELTVPNEPEQATPATQISHEGDYRLRYLDGELPTHPGTGTEGRWISSRHSSEPGREETTWSPVSLFHPLPQHRQNFQFEHDHPSPNGHYALHSQSQYSDQDHPFTRVNHTPEPESFRNDQPSQQSCHASAYPSTLAYTEDHTGSGSGSVYASEGPVNSTNHVSNGYQQQYSYGYSNAGSRGDGYSTAGARTNSHDHQASHQNESLTDHGYHNHTSSLSYAHHTATTPSLTRSQFTNSGSPPHSSLLGGAIETAPRIAISHQDYEGHSSQDGGFYNPGSAGAFHFKSNNGYSLGRVGSPLPMSADCKFSPRSAAAERFSSPSLSQGSVVHTDAHRNRQVDVPMSRGVGTTRPEHDTSLGRIYEDRRLSIASALDSPARPLSPLRELTISPTPSVESSASLESAGWPHQRSSRRATTRPRRPGHGFAPFVPGGMSQLVSKSKEHWCTVCNKPFKRPSTLATHMNIHTGEKPYFCPVRSCGRRFSVSSNLTRHLKTHKLPGATSTPRGPRSNPPKRRARPMENERRPRALQERKNVEQWCPESLRGMRNAKFLSSRGPFVMPESAVPLTGPLPPVRPFGQVGDENYEERDSFYYAQDSDELHPYHPTKWHLRPTLPGPLPSAADREIYNRERARAPYGYGAGLSESGGLFGLGDRV